MENESKSKYFVLNGEQIDHNNAKADGIWYRSDGQVFMGHDDNFYIRNYNNGKYVHFTDQSFDTVDLTSAQSGNRDDDPTSVACPTDYTLTGCSCYSPWRGCSDGGYTEGNKCIAKSNGDSPVFAKARCVRFNK